MPAAVLEYEFQGEEMDRAADRMTQEAYDFVLNVLTEKKFVKWLRQQPENTKLVCGNPKRCAIAQYLATHEDCPSWVRSLMVDGEEVEFIPNAKALREAGLERSPVAAPWSTFIETDPWVSAFVEVFDEPDPVACDIKGSGGRRGRTPMNTIRVLNAALGRRFRVSR